jgi:DnaK suppressor protein
MPEEAELTDAQYAELHRSLLRLQEELQGLLNRTDELDTVDLEQPIGRISRVDALQQQQMAAARHRRHELQLKQVAVALKAVAEDEFGDCKRCGESIGYPRLKARPETPCCVPCMSIIERGN